MDIDMDVTAPHPLVSGRILAGVTLYPNDPGDPQTGGIFTSDDYGETWQYRWPPSTGSLSKVKMVAFDSVDTDLIYAGTGGSGLWTSTNGGQTWQTVPISGVLPPVEIKSIATHPDISNTVYVRLFSMAATPNPEAELYFSQDAGKKWTELKDVSIGGGVDLLFAPPKPGQASYMLYTGCGSGLCRSMDGSQNWEQVEGVPRVYGLAAGSDSERVVVYVGSLGGVVSITEPPQSASKVIPGRGSLKGGGVNHLTMLQPEYWQYLPLSPKK